MHILRKIAKEISIPILNTRITANQMTIFSFGVGLVSVGCFLKGGYYPNVSGAILIVAAYILDHVDGEIARAKDSVSAYGYWLDAMLDRMLESLLFVAISYRVFMLTDNINYFIIGIFAMIGIQIQNFMYVYYSAQNNAAGGFQVQPGRGVLGWVRKLSLLLPDFIVEGIAWKNIELLLLLLCVFIGKMHFFLILFCLFIWCINLLNFILFIRKFNRNFQTVYCELSEKLTENCGME